MNEPELKPLRFDTRVLLAIFAPIGRLLMRFGYQPFAERCSWCHKDLPGGAASYINGRRVCDHCAERGRRRMVRAAWAYVSLSAVLIIVTGTGVVMSFRRGDPDAWEILPIMIAVSFSPLVLLWGVLRTMKAANKHAEEHELAVVRFSALRAFLKESIPGDGL